MWEVHCVLLLTAHVSEAIKNAKPGQNYLECQSKARNTCMADKKKQTNKLNQIWIKQGKIMGEQKLNNNKYQMTPGL